MHDRNIFKDNRPNFEELAIEFPEFKPYLQIGGSGRPYVNFKDPASLRALSTILLKKHFDISLDVPLDRLIPTIPLRLNYIHWIEDLVAKDDCDCYGIDIGCGASCVYGLLGNKMNHWKFAATEVDEESYNYAVNNVNLNNASDSIRLKLVKDAADNILQPALNLFDIATYDFTMCNPPFFDEIYEEEKAKDRTTRRPPAASVSTANDNETYTEGGEVMFVTRMINESIKIKSKIRWFTTMLGKKSSLKPLKKLLQKQSEVFMTTISFQQGRTMRWGLAWSFVENKLNFVPTKKEKTAKPYEILCSSSFLHKHNIQNITSDQKNVSSALWDCIKVIEQEIVKLKIRIDERPEFVSTSNKDAFEIIASAFQNTWTRQRQKRRKEKREKVATNDQNKHTNNVSDKTKSLSDTDIDSLETNLIDNTVDTPQEKNLKTEHKVNWEKNANENFSAKKRKMDDNNHDNINPLPNDCLIPTKKLKVEDTDEISYDLIFKFSCSVTSKYVNDSIKPAITLLCTEGNRDQFYQLCLYFNNILIAA